MLVARPYQASSRNATLKWVKNRTRDANGLVLWPTGTGKAFGIGELIHIISTRYASASPRFLQVTHSEELVGQNYEELKNIWPLAPAGIYCASLGRYDTMYPITFASIDSLDGNLHKFDRKIDFLLVDECHRIGPKDDSRYQRVYHTLKERNPKLVTIGFTATDYRMGQGRLTDPGGIFTDIIFDATTFEAWNYFFEEGYLLKPVGKPTNIKLSDGKLAMVGGDFNQKQLQEQFQKDQRDGVIQAALEEAVHIGVEQDRQAWIAFVPSIKDCEDVSDILNHMGIPTTFVHSKIKRAERRQRIKDYKSGLYRCIVNNGILTTGFNHKPLDMIIMLRKTASASLWVQMLGRGTRPCYADGFDLNTKEGRWEAIHASHKQDCLVLDFAGNAARLGPINYPNRPKPPGAKKGSDMPVKTCPSCQAPNHPSVRECFLCGQEFSVSHGLERTASTASLVKEKDEDKPQTAWFDVDKITYQPHYYGKAPSIKVTYYCGKSRFVEHVCLQHEGYARRKAENWWRSRDPHQGDVPNQIAEALNKIDSLNIPRKVLIWTNKTPKQVMNYEH